MGIGFQDQKKKKFPFISNVVTFMFLPLVLHCILPLAKAVGETFVQYFLSGSFNFSMIKKKKRKLLISSRNYILFFFFAHVSIAQCNILIVWARVTMLWQPVIPEHGDK